MLTMRKCRRPALIIIVASWYACTPLPKESPPSKNFEVKRIEAYLANVEHRPNVKGHPKWQTFPNHNLVHMQTCLMDTALGHPLENVSVEISSPLGKQVAITQKDGCFPWRESIDFCFLAPEEYWYYPVSIKIPSNYGGEQRIPLIVNPWRNDGRAVLDLRFDSTIFWPKKQIAKIPAEQDPCKGIVSNENTNALHLKDISFRRVFAANTDVANRKEHYQYDMALKMQIKRFLIDGPAILEDLKSAQFNAELVLFTQDTDGIPMQLAQEQSTIDMSMNVANKRVTFALAQGLSLNPNDKFDLLIKLYPTIGHPFLKPIIGILPMQHLANAQAQQLIPPPENIARIVESENMANEYRSQINTLTDKQNGQNQHINSDWGVQISHVKASYGGLVQGLHNGQKTVRSRIKICLSDSRPTPTYTSLAKTTFKVTALNQQNQPDGYPNERIHRTDVNGCLETYFYTHYNEFQCEGHIPTKLEITALTGNFRGITKQRTIAINPWNKSDYGYDLETEDLPPKIKCTPPNLSIDEIQYSHQDNLHQSYLINQFLHISLQKNYHLRFRPHFYKNSSYDQNISLQQLKYGKIQVELSIYTPTASDVDYSVPNLEQFALLSATRAVLQVSPHGIAEQSFTFPFSSTELPYLGRKNILLISLVPLEHGPLKGGNFVAPFYGLGEGNFSVSPYHKAVPHNIQAKKDKIITSGIYPGEGDNDLFKMSALKIFHKAFIENFADSSYSFSGTYSDMATIDTLNPANLPKLSTKQIKLDPATGVYRRHPLSEIKRGRTTVSHNSTAKGHGQSTQGEKDPNELINAHDFIILTENSKDNPPVTQMSKLCSYFYALAQNPAHIFALQRNYKACLQNPNEHIHAVAVYHIQKLISPSVKRRGNITAIKPQFELDNIGSLRRGMGFFAAQGMRSSRESGSKEYNALENYTHWGATLPFPMHFGHNSYQLSSNSTFSGRFISNMKTAFNRSYTTQEIVDWEYNQITFSFNAQLRKCLIATSKKKCSGQAAHM